MTHIRRILIGELKQGEGLSFDSFCNQIKYRPRKTQALLNQIHFRETAGTAGRHQAAGVCVCVWLTDSGLNANCLSLWG